MNTLGVGYRLKEPPDREMIEVVHRQEARQFGYYYLPLVNYDIAYIVMLGSGQIIPSHAVKALLRELLNMRKLDFKEIFDEKFGDILVNREMYLSSVLGGEIAGYLHTGRNRGETLHGILPRLFLRNVFIATFEDLWKLGKTILTFSEQSYNHTMPMYNHLQKAQLSTVSYYFASYIDSILRDLNRLKKCWPDLDVCPLICNSSGLNIYNIDQKKIAGLLGFSSHSRHAREIWFEDYFLELLSCTTISISNLAKLVEELNLWTSTEYNFFQLSDSMSSTSTALPQKKNPFVLKYLKGYSAFSISSFEQLLILSKTFTGEADFHFFVHKFFQYFTEARDYLKLLTKVIENLKINQMALGKASSDLLARSSFLVKYLIEEEGVAFRNAHKLIGALVRVCEENSINIDDLPEEVFVSKATEILKKKPTRTWKYFRVKLERTKVDDNLIGTPQLINNYKALLNENEKWLSDLKNYLKGCENRLEEEALLLLSS